MRRGGRFEDRRYSRQSVASGPGPEVWPQPGFDASTGLSLQNAVVAASALTFSDTPGTTALCVGLQNGADTMVSGQTWTAAGVVASIDNPVDLVLGCAANSGGGTPALAAITATGAFSVPVLLATVTSQRSCIKRTDGSVFVLSSFSLTRNP